jgi:hypothetical protein
MIDFLPPSRYYTTIQSYKCIYKSRRIHVYSYQYHSIRIGAIVTRSKANNITSHKIVTIVTPDRVWICGSRGCIIFRQMQRRSPILSGDGLDAFKTFHTSSRSTTSAHRLSGQNENSSAFQGKTKTRLPLSSRAPYAFRRL